jgi:hypothetical protein
MKKIWEKKIWDKKIWDKKIRWPRYPQQSQWTTDISQTHNTGDVEN